MTMRISTNFIYSSSGAQIGTLQSQLARTQQQLSTNRRMLSAADDPIASARALEVTQAQSINAQFATNRQNARSALSQEEVALTGVQKVIQDVQVIAVAAANGTNSASDRATYANELQGRLDDLLSLANSSDGNGGYVFSGYQSGTVPFVRNGLGKIDYLGDQGQTKLQIASARTVAISDPGSAVFTNLATGNGNFVTAPAPLNGGTGVISAGTVADDRNLTGHTYSIDFTVVAGTPDVTTYVVTDKTTNTAAPAASYKSGEAITVGGMKFDIQGAPATGDKFSVAPSERQSLFETMSQMIATLRAPIGTDSERQASTAGLSAANGNLTIALDNVLTVRSSVGSRMKEFDTLDAAGEDADIQYAATLSNLQDLDIIKAISTFTQQQASLEAAQKTFKSVSSLSLFNYIG